MAFNQYDVFVDVTSADIRQTVKGAKTPKADARIES